MKRSEVTHWTDDLVRLQACDDAVEWARGYDTMDAAWAACERGDWMLWLACRWPAPTSCAATTRNRR